MQAKLLLQSYAVDAVAHGCDAENQTELVETDVLTVGIERLRARLFGREQLEPPVSTATVQDEYPGEPEILHEMTGRCADKGEAS